MTCVCGATMSETMRRKVRGIQANGRDGFFEKAGEMGECDGLKCGPLRYAKKRRVSSSWHQLEIMMNGCNWAKVGFWDKRKRNQPNAFSMYNEEAKEGDKLAQERDTCNETKLDRAKLWLRNDTNNNKPKQYYY